MALGLQTNFQRKVARFVYVDLSGRLAEAGAAAACIFEP